jgi:hypothetical protein
MRGVGGANTGEARKRRTEIETVDADSDEMTRENRIHNEIDELMNTLDTMHLFGTLELEVLALQTISKPSYIGLIIGLSRNIEQESSKAKLCHLQA